MRKHFLILMLMALLPFTAWAEGEPTAKENLVYDGSAQVLLNGGTTTGKYFFYAAVLNDAAKPGKAAYGAAVPAKTNAADYDVYYVMKDANAAVTDAEAAAAVKIDASIAAKPLTITLNLGAGDIEETDYTGAVINPGIKVNGSALADPYVATWSSQIKNAGSYTVTVQKTVTDDEVVFVNEEGTADFLVNKVPLSVNAKHVTITYGDAAVENNALYTATGWKGADATDPEVNNLVVNVNFGGAQPTNAGVHPFTITAGTVNNYAVTVSVANANLTIEKKALTIQAVAGAGFDYGEKTDYAPTYTYDGLLPEDANTDGTPKDGVLNSDVTFTAIAAGDVNFFNTDGSLKGNAGSYVITPVVVGSGTPLVQSNNYTVTCLPTDGTTTKPNLVVAPKSLAHTHVTIAAIPSQEYAGTARTPVITITDSNVYGEEKTLTVTTDYTVAWAGALTGAGTYTGTFTGVGNYTTPATAPTKTFTITPAPLTVLIKDQEKTYNGDEFDFGYTWSTDPTPVINNAATVLAAKADIYGIKNNEALDVVFTKLPILEYAAINGSKKNVSDAYVISVQSGTGTSANYDVVFDDGTLEIKPQTIYLKADDLTQAYGKADKTLTYSIYSNAARTAGYALATGIETGKKNNTYLATAATLVRESGDGFGEYAITFSTAPTATSNYTIDETLTPGVYTIGKAQVRIIAENKTKTYDGVAPVQSAGNVASETDLTYKVIGLIDEDDLETAPTLSLVLAEGEDGTDYKAAGYVIKAEGAVLKNPANYEPISYQNGVYTIEKKQLTVTAKPQGLLVGEKATDLDNSLVEFDGLIDADKGKVTATLAFSANVQVDGSGKIKAIADWAPALPANGIVVNGIEVTGIAGAKAGNYFTSVTTPTPASYLIAGNLLITDATELITITPANKATWTAADEATLKSYGWQDIKDANNKKATVKFASFTMAPERWYTMVLPFKTNVAEISSKLGYAVVNVLNTSNNTNEVKFKLHMQDIEANEPFLVKVYKQIDLADLSGDADATDDPLTFTGKTIAYVETPSVADAKGTQFIGTFMGYIGTEGTTDEYYMATSNGKWYNAGIKGDDGKCGYTRPSGAYLKVAEGVHARILIEEPDGTTSIQTITANGEMVPAQGWYTLNGVKLQGVPTEKGIYINNGKKVVIK